jgi:hypothetical protein
MIEQLYRGLARNERIGTEPAELRAILWYGSFRHRARLARRALPSVAYIMVSAHVRRRVTSREFLTHPAASGPSELVRGEIRVMTPAGGPHGLVAGEIFAALKAFVDSHALGVCFPDNTGFELPGLTDTVRSPDTAFIRAD